MTKSDLGVLLMAYGTPTSSDEIEPYYTHIRHGRTPTPELLNDLKRRYKAIGGLSPLNEITQKQAQGLEAMLNEDGKRKVRVFLGMKHTHPFIEETVDEMAKQGIRDIVALVLAPHYSAMSVGSYLKSAQEAASFYSDMKIFGIKSWHLHPDFIDLLANRVKTAMKQLQATENSGSPRILPDGTGSNRPTVIFSAHSLPARILESGDPYAQQLKETGQAVAEKLQLQKYLFAWQSAGRTADSWLGPDILDVLQSVKDSGERQAVICSAGFVSDHLEVLYDIDIECRHLCETLGLRMIRTQSLNADKEFLQILAKLVRQNEPKPSSEKFSINQSSI